ncbi:phage host-nuclease inhibitor protein Gam [Neisseria perflava]|uniref:host-nuclease inhibitor Gam family protein n=1 Tax=Neisseria perflava TaxID=33053 RepID=UPI0020A09757|nr:host-nuclease inhibitor Gam family protein [Neisseria perflava]MCP1772884.1 phage host-nuclease inhibitor protein Gam [Neisseria perflava]
MATKAKTKTAALVLTVQTREEAQEQIRRLGDIMREREGIQADMNNAIAALQEVAAANAAPLDEEAQAIEAAVHAWATANRDALTDGGKVKFADLTTGMIKWRNNPPKCSVSGVDAVIALLEGNSALERFVRTKKEVNKDAVLNEAEFFAAHLVPGLKIVQGKEFFVIEPFNQELA